MKLTFLSLLSLSFFLSLSLLLLTPLSFFLSLCLFKMYYLGISILLLQFNCFMFSALLISWNSFNQHLFTLLEPVISGFPIASCVLFYSFVLKAISFLTFLSEAAQEVEFFLGICWSNFFSFLIFGDIKLVYNSIEVIFLQHFLLGSLLIVSFLL